MTDRGRSLLRVLATGTQALVQDLGRPGLASLGVGRAGAADRAAHALAARLLAQDPSVAGLEVLLGGLVVRVETSGSRTTPLTICLAGAPAPATVDDRPVALGAPLLLHPGQVLSIGVPTAGLRTYLAVRGGVAVPSVLGSRSHDTLAGLGPPPLAPGDLLPVGDPPPSHPHVDVAPTPPVPDLDSVLTLRVSAGPRADWVEAGARGDRADGRHGTPAALLDTTWTVSEHTDRVGTRLEGTGLTRAAAYRDRELASEPMVRGAVQVPPDGRPVVFGADHPVTGGYPVVAVVLDADVDRLAQARPGQRVRFRPGPGA
ncbi:biotin-dependent carboxyltransferase family protein [Ornithinimicrobium flavum]|uniref:5-oxoprolinase subunit C family protein n=1 Tax=Ornithinimicrobium flavum TaxID=1288636 RepID=UPI00106F1E99|nr:biotin-dependent carboxyltransferase family protein [Ornithinimicrobium flavum]